MNRLLILGCSAAKRHDAGLMPAIERYDGPAFRVLRLAQREGNLPWLTWIRILSAKYGLMGPEDMIEDYNQVMTPQRAAELVGAVSVHLFGLLRQHPECNDIFINVGAAYAPALAGFADWCLRHAIRCTVASGGIGTRCSQLKVWLEARSDEQGAERCGR